MSLTQDTKVNFWKKFGFTNIGDLAILEEDETLEEIIEKIEDTEYKALRKVLKKELKPHLPLIKNYVKENKRLKKQDKEDEILRRELEQFKQRQDRPPPPPMDDDDEKIEDEDDDGEDYNAVKRLIDNEEIRHLLARIVFRELNINHLDLFMTELREMY